MAAPNEYTIRKIRDYVKNPDGTYSLIHRETSDDIVVSEDGRSIRARLTEIQEWIDENGGIDTGNFKISYKDSILEFPNIGDENTLYIVKTIGDEAVYRWDNENLKYYLVSNNYNNIGIIDGGNASG